MNNKNMDNYYRKYNIMNDYINSKQYNDRKQNGYNMNMTMAQQQKQKQHDNQYIRTIKKQGLYDIIYAK